MSDDSFVKEVDDELRTDQLKSLWERYGIVLATIAVAIVVGTAAMEGWNWWQARQASASGDVFLSALKQANDGKRDDALKALSDLEKSGSGAYPLLARMRTATELATNGDAKGAIAAFESVAADTSVDPAIRDIAHLRAALLLVDNGTYEDVAKHAELLATDANAFRFSAKEALGLAAWKAGKAKEAKEFFEAIADVPDGPRAIGERANLMLSVIAASGLVPEDAAKAAAPDAGQAAPAAPAAPATPAQNNGG